LVVRDKDILSFDVDKQQGFASYSFGDYTYCGGVRADETHYTICATNNKQEKVALQFDLNTPNTGSIDKRVARLLKFYEVDDISAYGSYIYIIPNYGPPVYDSSIPGYGPDPAEVTRVDGILNQEIDRVGLDRNIYHIINSQ